jgi:hypothetical protein
MATGSLDARISRRWTAAAGIGAAADHPEAHLPRWSSDLAAAASSTELEPGE